MRAGYVLPEGEVCAAPAHAVLLVPLVDESVLLVEHGGELDVFVDGEDEAALVAVLAVVVPGLRCERAEDLAVFPEDEQRRRRVRREDFFEGRGVGHVFGLFEESRQDDCRDFGVGHQIDQHVLAC